MARLRHKAERMDGVCIFRMRERWGRINGVNQVLPVCRMSDEKGRRARTIVREATVPLGEENRVPWNSIAERRRAAHLYM